MKLAGRIAIVTGAGAGIGEAAALLFSKEGAAVCCNSLSDSAHKVTRQIEESGGEAIFVKGDVCEREDAKRVVDATVEKYGRIDILFNNAGIVIPGTVETTSFEDWNKTMEVNIRSIFLMSQLALPELKKTGGTIVNNASSVALKGVKDRLAYTASKGAVLSVTRAMAMDCLEYKVRVNCICPGTIDTPSLKERLSRFDNPAQAREMFISRQPLGRFGNPQEIAEAVLYLVRAEFCTGIGLSVDGGMTV